MTKPFKLRDLISAVDDSSWDGGQTHFVYIHPPTGRMLYHSDNDFDGEGDGALIEELDAELVTVPSYEDLGLGSRLARDFGHQHLGEAARKVEQIFSSRGAFARFRDLLEQLGRVDEWHAFEAAAERQAVIEWARSEKLEFVDESVEAS